MKSKDEQIKKAVVEMLYWDSRIDASEIHVEVTDGTVTLTGVVPSYGVKEASLFAAWKVPGVKQIKNSSFVKFPTTAKILSDSQIEESIKKQLKWNDSTSRENIKVTVNKGEVSLEGYVDAYWKMFRAQKLASDMIGVVDIDNKLAVVPTEDIEDQVIATHIINAIDRSNLVKTEDVDVKVKHGIVTLSGTLPTRLLCEAALEFAYNTIGVKEVKDRLHVE
ncbi:MAG: BON domain-containing protein [Candidatus Thorarchaeota archaeon]|nr:BON domain-containing protein [Candidatus Thorarchaeota archaeon]